MMSTIAGRTRHIQRRSRHRSRRKGARANLKREAERLCALITKHNARCRFAGMEVGGKLHVCKGPLQAMHGYPKRAYPAVRYDLRNLWAGCAGAHSYFTYRGEMWGQFIADEWGEDLTREMRNLALLNTKLDMAEVVERLRDEAKARGIE